MFDVGQVLERVEKIGDLFAPVLKLKQKLPKTEKLESLTEQETMPAQAKVAPEASRIGREVA